MDTITITIPRVLGMVRSAAEYLDAIAAELDGYGEPTALDPSPDTTEYIASISAPITKADYPGNMVSPDLPTANGIEGPDDRGVPYNPEVHSGGADPMGKNGAWKKKRGVDAKALAAYEAPYLAPVETVEPPAPAPEAAAPPPPPVAPPAPAAPMSFSNLIKAITGSDPKVTNATVKDTVVAMGHADISALATAGPEACGAVAAALGLSA